MGRDERGLWMAPRESHANQGRPFNCVAQILLAAMVSYAAALAHPPDGEACVENSKSRGLGVAGMSTQLPCIDIDPDYLPVPVICFENRRVPLVGATLECRAAGSLVERGVCAVLQCARARRQHRRGMPRQNRR